MSKVAVLGAVNVDHIVTVATLPEPGETVIGHGYHRRPGGKGRNQAVAVVAGRGQAGLIGAVGDDDDGGWLRADVIDLGVDASGVRTVGGLPTGLALIAVDSTGENTIVVHPGANIAVEPVDGETLQRGGYGVLLCSLEVPLATVAASVAAARSCGVTTVVNAAPLVGAVDGGLGRVLAGTDVLVVNRGELCRLAAGSAGISPVSGEWEGPEQARPDPVALAVGWRGTADLQMVVTLGSEGALWVSEEGVSCFGVEPVAARSTVGAGDAFAGALAAGLAAGRTLGAAIGGAVSTATRFVAGARPDPPADRLRRKGAS
jgi:ribokinase